MGNPADVAGRAPIHVFASARSWLEDTATRQLEHVAGLPGITAVAGMPDLHPGKYGPVGCAILSDAIYPQFVGSDIGCGMGLFGLDVAARKLRIDKLADRLGELDQPWDGDAAAARALAGVAASDFDRALGSIGGGNHFCEVQAIEEIVDAEAAAAAGLDGDQAFVLVHSGSRGLGRAILEGYLGGGMATLDPVGDHGKTYLGRHDEAVAWARLNRRIIAERAAVAAGADARLICDLAHNMVEITDHGALHRKGAAPSDRGLVPVPGSRGTLSYLVAPLHPARREALASLAHGAGRKYDRASMHGRVPTKRSDLARLERNPWGGRVVCGDRDLLVEEAPDAYKAIERVIGDLVDLGLARVVATFRPLVTFKKAAALVPRDATRRERDGWRERREKRR